jgi:hypothetical protein
VARVVVVFIVVVMRWIFRGGVVDGGVPRGERRRTWRSMLIMMTGVVRRVQVAVVGFGKGEVVVIIFCWRGIRVGGGGEVDGIAGLPPGVVGRVAAIFPGCGRQGGDDGWVGGGSESVARGGKVGRWGVRGTGEIERSW